MDNTALRTGITAYLKKYGASRIEPIAQALGVKPQKLVNHMLFLYNNHYIDKERVMDRNRNRYVLLKLYGTENKVFSLQEQCLIFHKMVLRAVKERRKHDQS